MGCCYLQIIYVLLCFESFFFTKLFRILILVHYSVHLIVMRPYLDEHFDSFTLVFAFPSTRIPPRIIHPNAAFEESDFSSGLDTGWYSANGYFSRIYVTCIWQYLRAIQTSDWTFSKKYNLVAAEKMHQSSSCVNVENIQENYGSFLSDVYHLGLELYNSASISVHRIQIFDLRSDDVFVLITGCLSELTRTSTNPAPLKLKTRQMFSDSNNFCWLWERIHELGDASFMVLLDQFLTVETVQ